MSTFSFIQDLKDEVENFVESNMTRTNAADCGLDPRAGYSLYVNEEALVVEKNRCGTLDYYGGFEYVDKEARQEIGDYVFFFADYDGRVYEAVQSALDKIAEEA